MHQRKCKCLFTRIPTYKNNIQFLSKQNPKHIKVVSIILHHQNPVSVLKKQNLKYFIFVYMQRVYF